MTDSMTLKLAQAFGYDIDFAQDLRENDSFTVIYNDVYREGERLRDGDIIAATFINAGKRYTAFRYESADGTVSFYSEDGRPLRTSFLRTPVEFTRISSRFTSGRMHPILGKMRAHRGVDTPRRRARRSTRPATARSVPRRAERLRQRRDPAAWRPLQHAVRPYRSRFGNVKQGQHVNQGQLIGYVGMTGLASGPHLHYEFRLDGQHRDPLTVTLPKPEPLPGVELAKFRQLTTPLLARLKLYEGTRLAKAQ